VADGDTWLTRQEAAQRAHVSEATIGREVRARRLRAARVGGRRALRLKPEWVDGWLEATCTPIEDQGPRSSSPHTPAGAHRPRVLPSNGAAA